MKITRRAALSTAFFSVLGGCSAISGRRNSPEWSTPIADDLLTEKIYVDEQHVAVATPTGRIRLLSADSGELVGEGRSREHIGSFAGTPPVSIADQFLTITDQVYVVNSAGEVTWVEDLPDDGYANIRSPPLVLEGSVYTTTSEGNVYKIDINENTINELDLPAIYGYWWDSNDHRVVIGTESYSTILCNLDSKELLWSQSGTPVDYPCLYDSDVITSSMEDNQLVVQRIDPETSTERWTTSVPGTKVSFCDQITDEMLAIVSQYPWERGNSAHVTIIDAASGVESNEYELPPKTIPAGEISDSKLFLTSSEGAVFSVEPGIDRRMVFEYDGRISSPPTVQDNQVVVGTEGGQVILYELSDD